MLDLEAGQARERRFVADVTHELRTPVSALVGEASLLKARLEADPGGCPPEVTRLALLVNTDIARLRQLVDDLLEISRLDARAAETLMESVDLQAFLIRLVQAHGWSDAVRVGDAVRVADPARATGTTRTPGRRARRRIARTDKRRVERIIVNLVENSLQHGAAPVTIEVRRVAGPGPRPASPPRAIWSTSFRSR